MKTGFSKRKLSTVIVLVLLGIVGIRHYLKNNPSQAQVATQQAQRQEATTTANIAQLTNERSIVAFVKRNHCLPDYYLTKKEARQKGWQPEKGNLCEVLPGKAIGGDVFNNREGKLPKEKGRRYFEADINYNCGRRNADRLIYSNDDLIFITKDHYQSFKQQ